MIMPQQNHLKHWRPRSPLHAGSSQSRFSSKFPFLGRSKGQERVGYSACGSWTDLRVCYMGCGVSGSHRILYQNDGLSLQYVALRIFVQGLRFSGRTKNLDLVCDFRKGDGAIYRRC
jgi:hypothetical protein